jgi:hypothetical protein
MRGAYYSFFAASHGSNTEITSAEQRLATGVADPLQHLERQLFQGYPEE